MTDQPRSCRTTESAPSSTPPSGLGEGGQDEAAITIAAQIAYWWRMVNSDDYSEPECESPYWMQAAKLAVRQLQHEANFPESPLSRRVEELEAGLHELTRTLGTILDSAQWNEERGNAFVLDRPVRQILKAPLASARALLKDGER